MRADAVPTGSSRLKFMNNFHSFNKYLLKIYISQGYSLNILSFIFFKRGNHAESIAKSEMSYMRVLCGGHLPSSLRFYLCNILQWEILFL